MIIAWGGPEASEINDGIARFVASHIPGCDRGFTDFITLAVIDADELIAGVVYHNFQPESGVIELSAASTSKRWLTRQVLKAMFSYPFDQLGCQMVVLRVSERNTPMIRIGKAYGFQDFVIPRLRGRDEAEVLLTLTDSDWRTNRFNRR